MEFKAFPIQKVELEFISLLDSINMIKLSLNFVTAHSQSNPSKHFSSLKLLNPMYSK